MLDWLQSATRTWTPVLPLMFATVAMAAEPGPIDRGAPMYGEDNEYVYGELLGMSTQEIAKLTEEGVF